MEEYKRLLATLKDCEPGLLADAGFIEKIAIRAIRRAGMRLIEFYGNPMIYKADPEGDPMGGGITLLAMITTSHLAIHTSLRDSSVEFDCQTCGAETDPMAALETLAKAFKAKSVMIHYNDTGRRYCTS